MPRKMNTDTADRAAQPQIPAEFLEKLIPGPVTPGQFEDIFQNFKKAFLQQALGAELSHHLGYAPGQAKPEGAANYRNGSSAKTVLTDTGALSIDVPPDRPGRLGQLQGWNRSGRRRCPVRRRPGALCAGGRRHHQRGFATV